MIRRSGKGFKVLSEGGKALSKTLSSKAAAVKRLRQVEYFKAHHSHPFSLDPKTEGCMICNEGRGAHRIK